MLKYQSITKVIGVQPEEDMNDYTKFHNKPIVVFYTSQDNKQKH